MLVAAILHPPSALDYDPLHTLRLDCAPALGF
jgi:hypothetical protein